ncbi:MAG: polysaccharide deacetylase family protein [Clostridia bacterium]|nr:polysaccharide deacetylase family protein [Clostridia bacterium]
MRVCKNLFFFLAVPMLIIAMLFLMSAKGCISDTTGYEWYFQPNEEHQQPQVIDQIPLEGKEVLYCGDPAQKRVSITFDAGFDNGCHKPILDTLRAKGVSATFFVDGNFLKKNPDLIKQMAEEGHTIGNHSLNHADMTKLTDFETYRAQIDGWNTLLEEQGLSPSEYFRFPQGKFSARALDYNEKLGLKSVFWSFAYYDWVEEDQPEPSAALEKIMSRMHNGCILLLHSTSPTNAQILGDLIERLREEGYEIVSLSQMSE